MNGWIYVLKSESGLVKIGFSSNPERRVAGLRTANSASFKLLHCVEATRAHEACIHRLLAADCVRGEWYNLTEAVGSVIDKIDQEDWSGFVIPSKPTGNQYQQQAELCAEYIRRCAVVAGYVVAAADRNGADGISKLFNMKEGILWKFLYRPAEPLTEEYFSLLKTVLQGVEIGRKALDEMEDFASAILNEHENSLANTRRLENSIRYLEAEIEALAGPPAAADGNEDAVK